MTKKLHLDAIANEAIKNFSGQCPTLEGAIGCMYVANQFGWKAIYLIHDKKTIKKYENILSINFRESFSEVGPLATKSKAYKAAQHLSNFWKAVKGETTGIRTSQIE